MMCFETRRQVRNDYTITLDAQYLHLERGDAPLPPPKREVIVRRWSDDYLRLIWNEHELKYKTLSSKPTSQRLRKCSQFLGLERDRDAQ